MRRALRRDGITLQIRLRCPELLDQMLLDDQHGPLQRPWPLLR
jgi:hypothetical protein